LFLFKKKLFLSDQINYDMKKLSMIFAAFVLITLTAYTQKLRPESVPTPVKQAFAKKFPAAKDVTYEREKSNFEVNFKENGVETSANFNVHGGWLETETEIKVSDLPGEVTTSVAKSFKGYSVSEASKTVYPDKELIYELELKKDNQTYEVQFSPTGDILKTEVIKKSSAKEKKD